MQQRFFHAALIYSNALSIQVSLQTGFWRVFWASFSDGPRPRGRSEILGNCFRREYPLATQTGSNALSIQVILLMDSVNPHRARKPIEQLLIQFLFQLIESLS
jgi:hypothetical protein